MVNRSNWRQKVKELKRQREVKSIKETVEYRKKISFEDQPESSEASPPKKKQIKLDQPGDRPPVGNGHMETTAGAPTVPPKEQTHPGRPWTVSIAIPGSILDNAQSVELRTYLAGQIGRAAAIFCVDEIVVFDETAQLNDNSRLDLQNCNVAMCKLLEYLECPQYLRKQLFPLSSVYKHAGIMNPLDANHHVRMDDTKTPYREAVVLNRPPKPGKGSYANAGLYKDVLIDRELEPGVRVTLEMQPDKEGSKKIRGNVVSMDTPRIERGLYWGFRVRLADSLSSVFTEFPWPDGYDLVIGTSDKGENVDRMQRKTGQFKRALILFGGLKGLESCVENDERLKIDDPKYLGEYYVNVCPGQGSKLIRTEEAVLVALGALQNKIFR